MIQQYISVASAERKNDDTGREDFAYIAIMVTAQNEDEASGKCLRLCKTKWPASDGWYNHGVAKPLNTTSNSLWFAERYNEQAAK